MLGQDIFTQPLRDLSLYQEDWLGLRHLDEEGRLHMLEMSGDHMDFQWEWYIENIVIPYFV